MDISINGAKLTNLSSINVIIGKNGCGKSTILRKLDADRANWTHVKYISPERGGKIAYAPNVENNMQSNINWLDETRRTNHDGEFRQKSIAQLKNLEMLVNRRIANNEHVRKNTNEKFKDTLDLINSLLDNIELEISDKPTPDIKGKDNKVIRTDAQLSSGEKELISLASEILYFVYQIENSTIDNKKALLLLDEPDVHLHPDLQHRLVELLIKATKEKPITTIISTHSTAILAALKDQSAHVYFMKKGQNELAFIPIDEQLQNILPVFGAHPLSNIFNQSPILLVEGEDDERIWQQAVRTSQGKIKIYPCEAGDKDKLEEYENRVSSLIDSIYDNAKAFSLRDRDEEPYEINDKSKIVRMRLNCYAAENLLLTDDVLESLGTNWEAMKSAITNWIVINTSHNKINEMKNFAESFDRKNYKIKDMRLIFVDLAKSNKPWEVIVGKAIANLSSNSKQDEGSLYDFLGNKLVTALNLCS